MDGLAPVGADEGTAVITRKVYWPKLASGPSPGTERTSQTHRSDPGLAVSVTNSRVPSGVVTTTLGAAETPSPVKQIFCLTSLLIVMTVPELPAATYVQVPRNELWKNVETSEFGRAGLEAVPAGLEAAAAGVEAVAAGLDGCTVTGEPWLPGPEVVGELGVVVEREGAGWPFRAPAAQPARVAVIAHTAASTTIAERQAC